MKHIIRLSAMLITIMLFDNAMSAENITGTWQGKLVVAPETELKIQFVISQDADGSYTVILNSPEEGGIKNIKANSVSYDSGNLKLDVTDLSGTYDGVVKNGKIEGMWMQQGTSIPLSLTPKGIILPIEILSQYAGTYELAPGTDMMVKLEGKQLISQITGQGTVPIFAETETQFFPKVVDATIEFFKDDKGAISHLILRQGGRESVARRAGYEKKPNPIDGTWTATADGPDGNPLEVTYVLETLGKSLLGTVNTSLGGGPFSEGKIDGNKISFVVRTDPSTILVTTGTVSGDVINFTQRNGNTVIQFTAKRIGK